MIYAELRTDSQLLESVVGCKSVTILACTGCANRSIAYQKNLPAEKIEIKHGRTHGSTVAQTVMRPYAVVSEANRIKDFLHKNKMNAKVVLWEWPCEISSDAVLKLTGGRFSEKQLAKS